MVSAALAMARRALSDSREEVARCMAELKAAQASIGHDADGSQKLTITVHEVSGPIAVDRVSVRPDCEAAQERVVVTGIPCNVMLGPDVATFDLVLMAEHPPTDKTRLEANKEAASSGQEDRFSSETSTQSPNEGLTMGNKDASEGNDVGHPPQSTVSSETAVTSPVVQGEASSSAGDAANTSPSTATAQEVVMPQSSHPVEETAVDDQKPPGVEDAIEIADAALPVDVAEGGGSDDPAAANATDEGQAEQDSMPSSTGAYTAEAEEISGADVGSDSVELPIEPSEGGEGIPALPSTTAVAEARTDGEAATGSSATSAQPEEVGANAGATPESAQAMVSGSTEDQHERKGEQVTSAVQADQARDEVTEASGQRDVTAKEKDGESSFGCSTVTTELVVASTELDLESPGGQWRYLEAGRSNGESWTESAGVRFATSLETQDGTESQGRIVELSLKYDEAELRVRSNEAEVTRLEAAAAGADAERKKSAAGGNKNGGRKSTLRKGSLRKGGGALGDDSSRALKAKGKSKGPMASVQAAFGKIYQTARPVGTFAWSARNFVFFVSAVAVMHLKGHELAV